MNEIMDDLRCLHRPQCDVAELSLCGVRWASSVRDLPRERVVEVTLSPAIRGLLFDKSNDKPRLYIDEGGDPVPFEHVRDAVIEAGEGVLHFAENVGFVFERGVVSRFSLYGSALRPFAGLASVGALLEAFGRPAKWVQTSASGDPMFDDLYYERASRWLRWDVRFDCLRFISLGGDREDVVAGRFGSVLRQEVQA